MTNMARLTYSVYSALVWSFTIGLVGGGCSAKKLPPYPTSAPSSSPYFQVKDGLAIGIKPLTDPQESEKYFDTDLLARGVLAIFVSAENQSAPGTFLLLKERFTLQTAQREEHRVSDRDQAKSGTLDTTQHIMTAMAAVGYFGFFGVGGIPFYAIASNMKSHEERVKTKFVMEELQSKTISPGEETLGFVYFRRPSGSPGAGSWMLRVEARDVNNQEVKIFDFILNEK